MQSLGCKATVGDEHMYTEHFGFRRRPFADPERRDGCLSPAFEAALGCLRAQLCDPQCGLVLFTGPTGSGKTAVLRWLLAELPADTRPVLVWNAHLTFDELLDCVFDHLDLPPVPGGRDCMLHVLEARLGERFEAGDTVVLMLDDAHLLADATLAGLYCLARLQRAGRPLLRLLLAGSVELEARLGEQPLREQVDGHCRLPPLDRQQTLDYILAQLRAAGGSETLFTQAALDAVARHSGGLPRLIHLLCGQALLEAFLAGRDTVSSGCVEQSARDNSLPMTAAGLGEGGEGMVTQILPARTEPAPAESWPAEASPAVFPLAVTPAAPERSRRRISWRMAGELALAAGLGGAALGALLVLAWTRYSFDAETLAPSSQVGSAEFAAVVTATASLEPASVSSLRLVPEPRPPVGENTVGMADPEPEPGNSGPETPAVLVRARITRLLEQAERQLAELRYTRPAGDNALYSYRQVLRLDPGNPSARRGVARVKASFLRWANAARARGDLAKARSLLQTALTIDPDDAMVRRRLASLHQWPDDRAGWGARRRAAPPPEPRTTLRRQGFVNRD